ncbi:MAG: 8-oxo-dGTP diphosphatase MutT [Desulfobacteraceae bacterium]
MPSKKQITVTAAIIWQNGKVLITKRPEGTHLEGLWEFPGGKKEKAETLEECIAREIKEELGVQVRPRKLLLTVKHEYETKIVDLHIFECALVNGTPVSMEGQDMKWVRPRDMSDYTFPPPDIEVIKFLRWENQKRSEGRF